MWFILALISFLTFGLSGFFMKVSSYHRGSNEHLLWGLYLTGSLFFFIWMLITGNTYLSTEIFIAGIIVGFGSAIGNLLFMKALMLGPANLTSPLVNINILLTVTMSIIIFDEQIQWLEVIGITMLILAVSLIPIDPNESLRINNPRWYSFVLLATFLFFLRNGGLKITEELGLNNTSILFISYLFGLIWFTLDMMKKKSFSFSLQADKVGLRWGLLAGIFSFAGMQFYALALEQGPASIIAPLFAANSLVVAILSIWLYKERLSLVQTVSLLLLFLGIIFVRL